MEYNNSFLEPEIESSLSEEVDKPAEERSDLEYIKWTSCIKVSGLQGNYHRFTGKAPV